MSDVIRCPVCAEEVRKEAKVCKHCREILDSSYSGSKKQIPDQQTASNSTNPGTAALLNVFLPGAGHLYQGKALAGFIWFIATALGYACLIVPGLVIHVVCIISVFAKPGDAVF
jgi:hypothetical protein